MIVWVLYDVENDKNRNKIAKICKQKGLYRVQLSAFVGTIERSDMDELSLMIEPLIDESIDKVYIFTMSQQDLKKCKMLGQAFDKKLITDEIKSLFL